MKTLMQRFEAKCTPEPNSGCWLWTGGYDGEGYGLFWVIEKMIKAHRVSWRLHNGGIPDDLFVLHKCDVKCCVNPAHLFLGTQKDNIEDSIRKGRFHYGERTGASKLTATQVSDIKLQLLFGHKEKDIAKKYNVAQQSINAIKNGKNWRYHT
jgi:hypothetical protein